MPERILTEEQKEAKRKYDRERYLRKKAEDAKKPKKPDMRNKINRPEKYNITKKRTKVNECNSCGSRYVYINYNGCEKKNTSKKNHAVYGDSLKDIMAKLDGI
jgi:hypothetical protein